MINGIGKLFGELFTALDISVARCGEGGCDAKRDQVIFFRYINRCIQEMIKKVRLI